LAITGFSGAKVTLNAAATPRAVIKPAPSEVSFATFEKQTLDFRLSGPIGRDLPDNGARPAE
jgi:hypothetical protein